MGTDLKNLSSYNAEMKKSLLDKVYFMDKVDSDVYVDFGCADGELIKFLHNLFPEYTYIGYDFNPNMIELAMENLSIDGKLPENVYLCSDWNDIVSFMTIDSSVTLILNSVIHEVYSYSNLIENDLFWKRIFNGSFKYIVVRDMIPKQSINKRTNINDLVQVRKKANKTQLKDFENYWGSIEDNRNLIHFLLKYRWVENWEREVKENYFPLYVEKFMEHITDDYLVDFYDEFILPFTKRQIENDFNITIKDTTHIKCILRRI